MQMRHPFVARQVELMNLPMRLVQLGLRRHPLRLQLRHFLAHLMLPSGHRLFLHSIALQVAAQAFRLGFRLRDHPRELFVLRCQLCAASLAFGQTGGLFFEVVERGLGGIQVRGFQGPP
jgi:hypothetical protein